MLFTGDSKRWSDRSKIWKEGWRNLHQAHPAAIEAEVLLEGQGPAKVVCAWDDGAALEAQKAFVQPKGKPKTSLAGTRLERGARLLPSIPFVQRARLDAG